MNSLNKELNNLFRDRKAYVKERIKRRALYGALQEIYYEVYHEVLNVIKKRSNEIN